MTTFTLVIDDCETVHTSEHDSLRDAREALIRYQSRRGLWFTADRWTERNGLALQDGELMSGTRSIGSWAVSYRIEELAVTQ